MIRHFQLLALLFVVALGTAAQAQKNAIDMEKERTQRCPEGQYGGPHEGARRYYQDPYIWFVSREFAKRFCMPDNFIDDSLKGALALAVRIKPEEFGFCGFIGGPTNCPPRMQLLIDMYIDNTKVQLPKADPSVRYNAGIIKNSGWLAGINGTKADKRRKGVVTELEGERRAFSPHGRSAQDGTVMFRFMGVRDHWATDSGGFWEEFYRANWSDGIDLITLSGDNFGYQGLRNPDLQVQTERRGGRGYHDEIHDVKNPIRRWAIGVIQSDDYFGKYKSNLNQAPYPAGYSHVIELPHKVAQIIYQYDWQQGEVFFNSVKNALQPNGAGLK